MEGKKRSFIVQSNRTLQTQYYDVHESILDNTFGQLQTTRQFVIGTL